MHIPAHKEWLAQHEADFLIAGPFLDESFTDSGTGLIVIRAGSIAEATKIDILERSVRLPLSPDALSSDAPGSVYISTWTFGAFGSAFPDGRVRASSAPAAQRIDVMK
ncbi:MAG: hypothetical protein QOG96_6738 [Pseudonocardiales bacterium]|nr:hypothetical protein [Pseudonocardiales bacterium]